MSDFNQTLIFWTDFRKILGMSNAMQIGAMVAELFHADRCRGIWRDGRTDMTKLIVALCNFVNAPKSYKDSQVCLQNKASCFSETFDNCVVY